MVDRVDVVRSDVTSETLRRWGDLAIERGNVFASPEWYFTWLRSRPRERPFILVARDAEGRVIGVLPLIQSRFGPARLLRFAGGKLGDRFDLLCAPQDEGAVAAACALALAAHHRSWHALHLEGVDQDARWVGDLIGEWTSPGVRAEEWGRIDALPYISLSEADFEGYLKTRPSKVRSDVRRSVRRLDAHGARFRQITEPADLGQEMGRFFDLHDARWEASGGSAALDGEARRFHDRFAHLALRRGWLRLWFLDLEDRPVAGWYGYSIGGRYCFYLPGFDPAHGHLGVGTRLMIHTIEHAVAEGASTYDFLSGDEDYKKRFETGRLFTHSLLITRRRHGAQPVAATLAASIRAARRLPASVRARGRTALGVVRSSA